MESRFRVLFLIIAMISLSGCAATKNLFGVDDREAPPPTAEPPGQVIDPEVERREVKEPKIDREDFEFGAFAGIMSIEDFGSDLSYGLRLAYHITEGFFVEATAGMSRGGLTSFEILSGGARLISDSVTPLKLARTLAGTPLSELDAPLCWRLCWPLCWPNQTLLGCWLVLRVASADAAPPPCCCVPGSSSDLC